MSDSSSSARRGGLPIEAYLARNILHLILMPTEQCNFRCRYCYEDFQHDRMQPGTVRGVKNLLTRRAGELDLLYIAWFGGEPLLATDIVEDVQAHIGHLAEQHPRLRPSSSMTTNGYRLDRDTFARLVELGVREYQISFDGPREFHDRKRVMAGGQGTFDRIWTNLAAMRDVEGDFKILIRIHVDRENRSAIRTLLAQISATFGTDPRFCIFLRRLARMGGPNDAQLRVLGHEERGPAMDECLGHVRELGLTPWKLKESDNVCYASRANSFVVRSDGSLGKCTVALYHPENTVGRLSEDGRVELDATKMRNWIRGLWSGDEEELGCPKRGYADNKPVLATGAVCSGGPARGRGVELQ